MEKIQICEESPKLGLKNITLLFALSLLSILDNGEVMASYNPDNLKTLSVASKNEQILSDSAERIRQEIKKILEENRAEIICEEDGLQVFYAEDFTEKSEQEIRQELFHHFPELTLSLSKTEVLSKIKALLIKEQDYLLEKIKKTFRAEKNFVGFSEEDTVEMAKVLIEGKSHPFLNDLFDEFIERTLLTGSEDEAEIKNQETMFFIDLEILRQDCVEFLNKYYLLKALSTD